MAFLSRGKPPDTFTGARLGTAVEERARALRDWLGPGESALVLALPAGAEFVVTLLSCLVAGIAAVPVSLPRRGTSSDRFAHIVRDCGASAVLCLPESVTTVREAAEIGSWTGAMPPIVTLPIDPARLPDPHRPPAGGEAAPAVIQYTSGSTRAPKGVRLLPRHIVANCELVMRSWQMDTSARFVNWLPHFHDMGLMGGILYPLLCGGFSAQLSPYDFVRRPIAWLRAVSEQRASFSGGPAFAFAEVVRRVTAEEVGSLDLSCWRRAFCGAEPVPPRLLDTFHAHLAPAGLRREAVFACYGMAEMTLFAAGVPGRPDGTGRPAEAADAGEACLLTPETRRGICIVDAETESALPEGEIGEIWLRGESQGAGYLGLERETVDTFRRSVSGRCGAEWLRTGDLGFLRDGALFVTGRLKEILICHGRKIAAPEVEWLACSPHPDLNPMASAAFMPDPNDSGRAVLVAEIYPARLPADKAMSLRHAIRRAVLGEWGVELTDVVFVRRGRLPRTTSGKIRRRNVAQEYREGRFGQQPAEAEEDVPCPS